MACRCEIGTFTDRKHGMLVIMYISGGATFSFSLEFAFVRCFFFCFCFVLFCLFVCFCLFFEGIGCFLLFLFFLMAICISAFFHSRSK